VLVCPQGDIEVESELVFKLAAHALQVKISELLYIMTCFSVFSQCYVLNAHALHILFYRNLKETTQGL